MRVAGDPLTVPLPVVFTAQSKTHFYCRDAVCEFVLGRGAVPLNPFRLLGYFLGDRVERDLVRRANNTLVRRADELWCFGAALADGVVFEILLARELGKPVRFFTIASEAASIRELAPSELELEAEAALRYGTDGDALARIRGGD